MAINSEDIEKVREAADIVGVVSQFVALKKAGHTWKGLCPFHNEKTPSFSVNPTRGFYYCFGCQQSGDVITFVREMEGLDFPEAMEWLATKQGVQLRYEESSVDSAKRGRRKHLTGIVELAVDFYHDRLLVAPDAGRARAYLRSRGYDRDVVERFRLGYAPDDWDVLAKHLKVGGRDLEASGLGFTNRRQRLQDFFRDRVLFPIFDTNGAAVGFGGRQLPEGQPPKYKNSSETELYNKSKVLYALNWAKKDAVARNELIVCEGYTDVIGYFAAGLPRAVATCGTALTEDHVKLMRKFASKVVLSFDADGAGRAAADKFYEWERRYEIEVHVADLPDGADPGELAQEPDGPELLAKAIEGAVPFLAYRIERVLVTERLDTPEGRARGAERAMEVVAEHPNELLRDQYLMEVASRTRVEPERLRSILAKRLAMPRRRPDDQTRNPGSSRREGPTGGDDPAWNDEAPDYYDDDPALAGMSSVRPGRRSSGTDGAQSEHERIEPRERELLRLMIHRPADVAGRTQPVLFTTPITRRSYELLSEPGWEGRLPDEAPAIGDLLRRLTVETFEGESDPIEDLGWVVRDAALRARRDIAAEARVDRETLREQQPLLQWIVERTEELQGADTRVRAIDALLAWLVSYATEREGG
ncbi:MAG: DNA primase [Actinomycetia bacterium]|nr:DNA primase [Actinomycetes bacterium]